MGSLVARVPEVLADLSGPLRGKVRRVLPISDLVQRIWSSIRDLRDMSQWGIGGGNGERGLGKLAE